MTADPEQLAQWVADNPEAAAALRAEGAASERLRLEPELQAALATGRLEGAQAEANRAKEVRAQAIPGHEALVERLATDGKTTGPEAAVAILAAVREQHVAAAKARDAAIVPPLAHVAAPDDAGAGPAKPADPAAAVQEAQAVALRAQAIQRESAQNGQPINTLEAINRARAEFANGVAQ